MTVLLRYVPEGAEVKLVSSEGSAIGRPRGPLFAVLVVGPSMVPTLRHGDALLVRRGGRAIRSGDLVVGVFRTRPDLLVVKRAVRASDGGWELSGDNPLVTDDSRAYGVAEVVGRVVARYWPRPRWFGYRSV